MFYQPNIYIFISLLCAGVFLIFLFYKKDSRIAKVLRITSIVILLFLLLEPVIYAFRSNDTLAILIDTSKSMEPKRDTVSWWIRKLDPYPVKKQYFWFDTTLYNRKRGGGATDIIRAIECLPSHIGAVLLLSDGIYTRGRDPRTAKYSRPVYTISIERKGEENFRVVGYNRNYYIYKGDTASVEAIIEGEGVKDKTAWLVFFEGEKEISRSSILLPPDRMRKSYRLHFIPKVSGVHIYTLTLRRNEKENNISFSMNVTDRRIKVLYISGNPSFNLKFIRSALEKDQNTRVHSIIQIAKDRWLVDGSPKRSNIDIEDYIQEIDPDIVFLEDLEPSSVTDYIDSEGKCFVIGKGHLSPFIFGGRPDREGRIEFVRGELDIFSESLPSLAFFDVIGIKKGAKILAVCPDIKTAQGNMPVFASMTYGGGEVYSIASDILTPINFTQKGDHNFWIGLIRWIAKRGEDIHIETDKAIYKPGENIRIRAETREMMDEDVLVEIKKIDGQNESVQYQEKKYLYKKSPTAYEVIIDYLPPGRYEYRSKVNGNFISGEFYVEEPLPEDPNPYADNDLLTAIALKSGGKVIHYPDDIEITMGGDKEKYPLFPSRSPFPLVLLVVLLSIEWWILRK
ncbi:MAG: hypothetical protein COT45_06195 [bacterium (Candidatus Stahlbacteria) CG08_land_8_20_14_0_20_40_26]|nr:MAG: hypothetical protein COX49_10165 [bacterium (Candidatus Stahlbacteria) CG23_combo_of_CG06-09_8_20_14_all_40_9]PIS23514.1 MAG: hypothetical protein COT45_06195 [bacterium (Candidatus Stahlbacteria) CG08_land_8_20_14_0_20_40_26]